MVHFWLIKSLFHIPCKHGQYSAPKSRCEEDVDEAQSSSTRFLSHIVGEIKPRRKDIKPRRKDVCVSFKNSGPAVFWSHPRFSCSVPLGAKFHPWPCFTLVFFSNRPPLNTACIFQHSLPCDPFNFSPIILNQSLVPGLTA